MNSTVLPSFCLPDTFLISSVAPQKTQEYIRIQVCINEVPNTVRSSTQKWRFSVTRVRLKDTLDHFCKIHPVLDC